MNMIEKRKAMAGQGGFTIELLVVVAILAILAGVAVFAVSNLTADADNNACKVEKDTIKTAPGGCRDVKHHRHVRSVPGRNAEVLDHWCCTYLHPCPRIAGTGATGCTWIRT